MVLAQHSQVMTKRYRPDCIVTVLSQVGSVHLQIRSVADMTLKLFFFLRQQFGLFLSRDMFFGIELYEL